jgi:hypothetical protein
MQPDRKLKRTAAPPVGGAFFGKFFLFLTMHIPQSENIHTNSHLISVMKCLQMDIEETANTLKKYPLVPFAECNPKKNMALNSLKMKYISLNRFILEVIKEFQDQTTP